MSVWTVAIGWFLGKLLWNTLRYIAQIIDDAITKKLDEKNPNWRRKVYHDVKPKEPIGFKQTTIES